MADIPATSKREFFFKQDERVNSAYGLITATFNTYCLRKTFIQFNQRKKKCGRSSQKDK